MPTFDLVVEGPEGVAIAKRKIEPYKGQWSLPGLRQLKGERFADTIARIVKDQIGLDISRQELHLLRSGEGRYLGQYDGIFTTEHKRQDISTGYHIFADNLEEMVVNPEHFSDSRVIDSMHNVPTQTGAMYKFYLKKFFELRADGKL